MEPDRRQEYELICPFTGEKLNEKPRQTGPSVMVYYHPGFDRHIRLGLILWNKLVNFRSGGPTSNEAVHLLRRADAMGDELKRLHAAGEQFPDRLVEQDLPPA